MTHEQKAWYEYGLRVGELRTSRHYVQALQDEDLWPFSWRTDPCRPLLEKAARQAAQAARSWNPKGGRRCKNCAHLDAPMDIAPCARCNEYHNKWQPIDGGGV